MITGPTVKPPPNPFYGDSYERGLDPWHVDGAPEEFKDRKVWNRGKRKGGWYLIDGFGNQIGFTPDGTKV